MIELQHLGEPLVAVLLERLRVTGKLGALAGGLLADATSFVTGRDLLPLRNGDASVLLMDGEHKVDVAALGRASGPLAIEVKCGRSLRGRTFTSRNFVRPALTRHEPPRVSGTVPGLLEAHRQGGSWDGLGVPQQPLAIAEGPLDRMWILVARDDVAASLRRHSPGYTILSLDTMVAMVGGAESLDDLVLEMLTGHASFAERWQLGCRR